MDGWETRRRRDPGHDFAILRLGIPGVVRRVEVDTTWFKGNHAPAFGLDGLGADPSTQLGSLLAARWHTLVDRHDLAADTVNQVEVDDTGRVTFLRLRIHPDGGVARLRVWGRPVPDLRVLKPEGTAVDLASMLVGGEVVEVSDDFFGRADNLLLPGPAEGMSDGWETRRRRGDGHDWVVVRLGVPGRIDRVMVDTSWFRGNAPGWVSIDATVEDRPDGWFPITGWVPTQPDRVNLIPVGAQPAPVTHLRLNIRPDGGVARLRVFGEPDPDVVVASQVAYLDALCPEDAETRLRAACASEAWVRSMVQARPFGTVERLWDAVEAAFEAMSPADWEEAFRAHPAIGERRGRQTAEGEAMSEREQAGVAEADEETRRRLAEGQRLYRERFGIPYIVFASGRDAAWILADLKERLRGDDPSAERARAAAEQRKITELRIRRMLEG
ncbi:MAG: hypothetical protein KatS3mg011_0014 [Acidimicrobiia bacterium]|nr:MAG: hypothetical protein KatS3mg011_0014 [Acidimicrobiia bacterium]